MNITLKDLLDAGVHFGHQTKRWNPKSKKYIFDHRQGVSIIDLEKTYELLNKACEFVTDHVANGKNILLVGTKRQAQDIVREAATATGMPFAVNRWLGGALTNFETIKRSIAKFKKWQAMDTAGELAKLPKKEESKIRREMARMQRNFDGITEMPEIPAAMYVVDINHEDIAVAEGARCGIPVIALVDTNSDPTKVTFPIPGNDDAVKSVRIVTDAIVEAIQAGLAQRESRKATRAAEQKAAVAEQKAAAAAQRAAAEIDLSKVEVPAAAKDLVEEVVGDAPVAPAGTGASPKKPARRAAAKKTPDAS
jgi:small subunit ribosomal protein S2